MSMEDNLKSLQKMHDKKSENTESLFDQLKRIEEKLDFLIKKSNETESN